MVRPTLWFHPSTSKGAARLMRTSRYSAFRDHTWTLIRDVTESLPAPTF